MRHLKNCAQQGLYIYYMVLLDFAAGFEIPSQLMKQMDEKSEKKPFPHHRLKRSWVWNQFFVLEEYTGTDPLYVGKVRCLK